MFKVLLIETDKAVLKALLSYLQSEFGAEGVCVSNGDEGKEFFQENRCGVVITRNILDDVPVALNMLNFIYEKNLDIPTICMGDVEFAGGKYECLPDRFKLDDLRKKIIKLLNISRQDLEEFKLPDYIPIPIQNFYLMTTVSCDVFIRIAKKGQEDQYIKRIHAGDEFDKEVIQRYESNKLTELFIHKDNRNKFLDELLDQSLAKINDPLLDNDKVIELTNDSYEIGKDMLLSMGVTDHTVKLAEGTIKSMTNTVLGARAGGGIKDLLNAVLKNKTSYAYKHCYLISIFASGVVPKMEWGGKSQSNIEKMVFVAYFHDMLLTEDSHVKISSKLELHQAELDEKEKDLVMNHANKASTMVQQFPKSPPDVDVIIRQHHGTTNGVGFSENPNSSLSAMAIAFIVIENFVDEILNFTPGETTMKGIFDQLEEKYSIPSYRKVVAAIKETLMG